MAGHLGRCAKICLHRVQHSGVGAAGVREPQEHGAQGLPGALGGGLLLGHEVGGESVPASAVV